MSGPDSRLTVTFAPTNDPGLAQAVRHFAFQHFVHYAQHAQYCQQHGHVCSYDLYLDSTNAPTFNAAPDGPQVRNLWIYHRIEVCQTALLIERGYGGYGEPYAAEEHALLRWLLALPQLAMHDWHLLAGGDGYPYTPVAAGASAASLRAYLDAA